MSKDELNLPEGLKMSLISRHTFEISSKQNNIQRIWMNAVVVCALIDI